MDPLQAVSNRIAYLSTVLHRESRENVNQTDVVDSILAANSLLNSAPLLGREKLNEVIRRYDEIERMSDPNFVLENKQYNMKEIYLNTVVNDVAQSFETLQKIKELEPVLGAEYFENIPDVMGKLKTLIQAGREQKERNDMIEESLISSIQRYSEIQNEIHKKLRDMNDFLDAYEEALETQKKLKSRDAI